MPPTVTLPSSDELAPVVALRRHLHAHPELSGHEHETAARVVEFLTPLGPDRIVTGIGGTGIVATFDSGVPGPVLLFRSELDALPIVELGVDEHGSTCDGVSHKCGHDGHTAILCGLAQRLAARRPATGAVHLLFQPAEEDGTGAASVLADARFDDIRPDRGFAIHNMPGFPMHSFVIKPGPITAAVRSIVLRFTGRTAHASEPEKGENPSLAIADLLHGCADISVNDVESPDFCLITPVHVLVGSPAYGVSAGDGEVHLTIRTFANSGLAVLQGRIETLAASLAARDRLHLSVEIVEDFFANMNDAEATAIARRAAEQCGFDIITPELGLRGGEDFGLFSERFPCCMVLLGSGEDYHPIHNPHYDFRDELIATGVRFFDTVVRDQLG
ncbi:MAG: M20 metallopeptidase family protein [Ilumatobacteraceae bacterium]